MFITPYNLQGLYADALVHTESHADPHTPPPSSRPLRGIYRDVKAVIGQVSGAELSDNRLVTEEARERGMGRRRETENRNAQLAP